MKTLCVYCGSNAGNDPAYADMARALGARMAKDGIALVYGGGNVGLMGIVADAVLAHGGEAIGVIPQQLVDWEVAHRGLTRLEVVDSMHARKARMFDLADGFVALPGGFGTLEELFEATTWSQLGYHRKPVGLLNAAGYYDHLLAFLDHGAAEGFIRAQHRPLLQAAPDIATLLDALARAEIPQFFLAHPPPNP